MADTDALRTYTPSNPPTLSGSYGLVLTQAEFKSIQQSISLLVSVMKKLEVRIVALEP